MNTVLILYIMDFMEANFDADVGLGIGVFSLSLSLSL
jgi:hypothetical protein